jgi:DNA gyrase subunit B/topoisomerase-4 subunit B
MFKSLPSKLVDCQSGASDVVRELLIVEGDSAANAVANARDASFQAVLPMQGKPLNAWKASKPTVARNAFFNAIIESLGAGWDDSFAIEQVRYQKIVLIFDPDADGIHCGMLVMLFFFRWMKPLLESGRILVVRPPSCHIVGTGIQDIYFVGTPEDSIAEVKRLESQGVRSITRKPFRGLASMSGTILSQYCISPATRQAFTLRKEDAAVALRIFGGQ